MDENINKKMKTILECHECKANRFEVIMENGLIKEFFCYSCGTTIHMSVFFY